MGLHVVLDEAKCCGHGLCEAKAPEIFEVQVDGSLSIVDEHPSDEHRAACEAAVASCPSEALRLIES